MVLFYIPLEPVAAWCYYTPKNREKQENIFIFYFFVSQVLPDRCTMTVL
jgi:hypothetical protein